jgi:molybdate transport system substrate-binding protein
VNAYANVLGRFALCIVVLLAAASSAGALGADLRVLCPNALREPVLELARSYAKASGDRVEFIFASVGSVHKRIAGGERADVAIGTLEGVEALIKLGPGVEGSQAPIARSVLAIGVRPGRLRAGIETAESLAQTLEAARSIAAPDPRAGAPGGAQVAELLERLQLSAALDAKLTWVLDPREAVKRVASGEVDLALAMMSDLGGSAGIDVLGPIMEPATRGLIYAAFIPRAAARPDRARSFVAHLRTAEAEQVFGRTGYASPR